MNITIHFMATSFMRLLEIIAQCHLVMNITIHFMATSFMRLLVLPTDFL